ncbi:hypothetical protein P875_00064969 [Aspergillus parasiticus SU-1]|uniref:Rhodopsin domain-containing protein n=1 Tax=Aspergillus parasiticus (strain ATCC 56775 / NRRL 5862 / SRRC 143 / SU-1) TaxID=1403190 RepID=A0A0F0IA88_ASPPU|nr:hypothetical protein P875_00064969 [Aspergillus parasiticus SU-1]
MSASGDFGPAPPGVDLSENQNGSMLGAVITLIILGTLSVVLRIYARTEFKKFRFSIDDYLSFAALLFAYSLGICVIISVKYKNGHHVQALTKQEFTVIWKLLYAHVMLYAFCVTCTKTSIILFYKRIFNLRYSLYFAMFFILGYFIVIIVTVNVACDPIPYFWEQYTDPNTAVGSCIDIPKFFFGNGIAAVLIDIMILIIPIPITWKLQMPKTQRLAVIGILLLGSFVCIAGIVRLVFLNRNTHSDDATWSVAPVFVWSCVEPSIGIVCACLPTLSPLFRRWWSSMITGKSGSASAKQTPSGYNLSTRKSRLTDPSVTWTHWDEVELVDTVIERKSISMQRRGSEGETSSRHSGIRVREEVTISYTAV